MKKITVFSRVFQQDYLCHEYKYFDIEVELEDELHAQLMTALEAAGDEGLRCGDEFPGNEVICNAVFAYLDAAGEGDSNDPETGHLFYDFIIGGTWSDLDGCGFWW